MPFINIYHYDEECWGKGLQRSVNATHVALLT